jgi:1,4-alpha-glucan branching enzyme
MSNSTQHVMTDLDTHLWAKSRHYASYLKLGAHPAEFDGQSGVHFAVWAPNARFVGVMGEFNQWQREATPLQSFDSNTGIWSGFVAGVAVGMAYKFSVASQSGQWGEKCDPYGFWSELRPQNASRVCDLTQYRWQDTDWMEQRKKWDARHQPVSVYEMHLGSWMRRLDGSWMNYNELALKLIPYLNKLGFTHIELLPITEHPFDGSWGYQTTGYFAPTSRHGDPDEFRSFVDQLHQAGIGVVLDWVPAHFPRDGHGLSYFDGTHLFEHADPRQGAHPEWGTLIFNYERNEVKNFLISSAMFWLKEYHIDGLRVDAVASMLYLDYGRNHGEWIANSQGGRENLGAIQFLQELHNAIQAEVPDAFTVAEESTSFPLVTGKVADGGLGFTFKWNMGWMNDTLKYFETDPLYRKWEHGKLTFGMMYQYSEHFMLSLSHDEVVHLKKSMLSKMPGDEWQMRANLRCLCGYQVGFPGKKLIFMGSEFGQWTEWSEERALDWDLLSQPNHRGLLQYSTDLFQLYRREPALFQQDADPNGFEWMECDDADQSLLMFVRRAKPGSGRDLLILCNFTPLPRKVQVPLPRMGTWEVLVNSDSSSYGGSGIEVVAVEGESVPCKGRKQSCQVTLPPLSTVFWGHLPDTEPIEPVATTLESEVSVNSPSVPLEAVNQSILADPPPGATLP